MIVDLAYPPKEMQGMSLEEMVAYCDEKGYGYFHSIKEKS